MLSANTKQSLQSSMIRPQCPAALPLNINRTCLLHYQLFQPWYFLPNWCHLKCFTASSVYVLYQPIATQQMSSSHYQTYIAASLCGLLLLVCEVRRWNLWFPSAGVFAEVLAGRATGTQRGRRLPSPLCGDSDNDGRHKEARYNYTVKHLSADELCIHNYWSNTVHQMSDVWKVVYIRVVVYLSVTDMCIQLWKQWNCTYPSLPVPVYSWQVLLFERHI